MPGTAAYETSKKVSAVTPQLIIEMMNLSKKYFIVFYCSLLSQGGAFVRTLSLNSIMKELFLSSQVNAAEPLASGAASVTSQRKYRICSKS